jgi:hypothetical protein
MRERLIWAVGIAGVTMAFGCSEGTSPAVNGTQRVNLMMATAPSGAAAAAPTSVTVGTHTLDITQVQLVLDRIRLKRVEASINCDADDDAIAATDDHGGQNDDADDDEHHDGPPNDQCEKFITGPLLLDLPLTDGPKQLITVDVDTGTYRRAEFFVHKVVGDDGQFATDHPDLVGKSILVTGTFDGVPFTFVTNITAKQKTNLDPPLVVTTAGATDLTLFVDVSTWFLAANGDLIDPASAASGEPNEHVVRRNIKRSFHVFKDKDHDGKKDHDDH